MNQMLLREFPVELLSNIFVYSLPDPKNFSLDIPLIRQPPQQLLLVSQRWCAIALTTPELWQSINVSYTNCNPEVGTGIMKRFSRAGTLPLSLRARLPSGGFMKNRLFIPSWEYLQSVDISGDGELQSKIVRIMLEDAPALVSAKFEISDPPTLGHFSVDCPKTELSHLRHLTIKFRCRERSGGEIAISKFFETLTLPVLEEFDLETPDTAHDDDLPESLVGLQERSRFPLRYLRLVHMEWNHTSLIRFLRTVPTLERFHLRACTTDVGSFHDLFSLLQYIPESTDNILPNLTQIEILEAPVFDWELDGGVDFLIGCFESRWWPDDSLPYRQEGLRRLMDVIVRRVNGYLVTDLIGAEHKTRAERLRAGGMNLVYPALLSEC